MTVDRCQRNGLQKQCSKSSMNSVRQAMKRKGWKVIGAKVESFIDNLVRLVVDVPDLVKHRKWMKQFKQSWRQRLEQLELWMVSYPIQVE
jgi:hypothetical protein